MANIITDLEEIRKINKIGFISSNEIAKRIDYTKGYVSCVFNFKVNDWECSYFEDRQEAINHFETYRMLAKQFPEIFDLDNYSEMYVYSSYTNFNAKWVLAGVVLK